MEVLIEVLKAFHFIGLIIAFIIFSLWIREEFSIIFKRKKFISIKSLRIIIVRLLIQNNDLGKFNSSESIIRAGALVLALCPLIFLPLTDRFDLFGNEVFLGLISNENSIYYSYSFLILGEILRNIISKNYSASALRIPMILIVVASLFQSVDIFSFEQIIQFQKSFNELGMRNYLLFINPIGAIFLGFIIIDELSNPRDNFTLTDHLYLNTYIILFIYCFLGGFGLPSFVEKLNITPGLMTAFFQCLSLFAKFIFCIIVFWVMRYTVIKQQKKRLYA